VGTVVFTKKKDVGSKCVEFFLTFRSDVFSWRFFKTELKNRTRGRQVVLVSMNSPPICWEVWGVSVGSFSKDGKLKLI